jgi:hypothetical protein
MVYADRQDTCPLGRVPQRGHDPLCRSRVIVLATCESGCCNQRVDPDQGDRQVKPVLEIDGRFVCDGAESVSGPLVGEHRAV